MTPTTAEPVHAERTRPRPGVPRTDYAFGAGVILGVLGVLLLFGVGFDLVAGNSGHNYAANGDYYTAGHMRGVAGVAFWGAGTLFLGLLMVLAAILARLPRRPDAAPHAQAASPRKEDDHDTPRA